MDYSIITFGNGEILKGIFDAIATCLNSHSGTLYIPLIRISLIIGALMALMYAVNGDYMRAINGWILPMTAIMHLFFVPHATLWIIDPVTKYHQKVDHVPYGLAMIASHISRIGFAITEQIEKVFTLPDDLKYQKTGSLFASHLLQQAKTFRITNEDLAENMRQFVGQCVAYDAILGRKYTIEDLRHSSDIWQLVSSNASPVRSFLWRDLRQENQPQARSQIITCREGVTRLNNQWNGEIERASTLFGKKIFGKNSQINARAEILRHLPIAYSALTDMAQSAQEILKQNMMIYAVVDGLEQKSTSLGNAPNFAARRAYLQQRSTYETLGAMAAETLPTMKAVLEAIAYAAFLFVIPLSLLPMGWRFIISWVQTLLWLQMWAPLYAVLNYIMTMAARAKSIAALSISNDAGVTIANSVGLVNVNADISAMAGYLAMSIPFLCIALVKGVGSFVHLASHLSNVTQGAASQAASETVTGNYSYGNVSQGNNQIANTSMLNQSYAASYRSGSFHMADGRSDLVTSADGQQILNVSSSNLPVSINAAESRTSQLSEQASNHFQNAISQSEASSKSLSSSLRNMVNLSEQVSKGQHFSDQVGSGKTIEQTKAIQKASQMIEDFAQDNRLSKQQAANILADASVSANLGIAGARGNLQLSGSAYNQEDYTKALKYAQSEDFQQALREASQASQNLSHSTTDETTKRYAEDVSGSFEEANSLREEAMKSYRISEDYSKQAAHTQAFAATINANYTQEFVDWLAVQRADNTGGQIGKHGASHIMANEPSLRMTYAEKFMSDKGLYPKISSSISQYQGSGKGLKTQYQDDESIKPFTVNDESISKIRNQAHEANLAWDEDKANTLRHEVENAQYSSHRQVENDGANISNQYIKGQEEFNEAKDRVLIGQAIKAGASHVGDVYKGVRNVIKDTENQIKESAASLKKVTGESQTKD